MKGWAWFWFTSVVFEMFILGDIWDEVSATVRIMVLVAALCAAWMFYHEVSRHEDDTL